MQLNQHLDAIRLIQRWNLEIIRVPVALPPQPYIIFHTKYRMIGRTGRDSLFDQLTCMYQQLKLPNYQIILMGERRMVPTNEQSMHRIATIYDSLLELKRNNHVIDLTRETIYN